MHVLGKIKKTIRDAWAWRFEIYLRYGARSKASPKRIREWCNSYLADLSVTRSPDRTILLQEIFPSVLQYLGLRNRNARILWIGCARYTKSYYDFLESTGFECVTLERWKQLSKWGHGSRHVVGDLKDLAMIFSDEKFDFIFCNGIFGWGVNDTRDQQVATEAMARSLLPNGKILIGWNTDKMDDPRVNGVLKPWFQAWELPGFGSRKSVHGTTHIYDLLQLS